MADKNVDPFVDKKGSFSVTSFRNKIQGTTYLNRFYFHFPDRIDVLNYIYGTPDKEIEKLFEDIFFYASNVTVPGRGFQMNSEFHYPNGFRVQTPNAMRYGDGNITMNFYVDAKYLMYKFFNDWMNKIQNQRTGFLDFYNSYTTNLHVYQIPTEGFEPNFSISDVVLRDDFLQNRHFQFELVRCFPAEIRAIEFKHDAAQRVQIEVQMKYSGVIFEPEQVRKEAEEFIPEHLKESTSFTTDTRIQFELPPSTPVDDATADYLLGVDGMSGDNPYQVLSQVDADGARATITTLTQEIHQERMQELLAGGWNFMDPLIEDEATGITYPNPDYLSLEEQTNFMRESEREAYRRIYETLGLELPIDFPQENGVSPDGTSIENQRDKLLVDLVNKGPSPIDDPALHGGASVELPIPSADHITNLSFDDINSLQETLPEISTTTIVVEDYSGEKVLIMTDENGKTIQVPVQKGDLATDREGVTDLLDSIEYSNKRKHAMQGLILNQRAQQAQKELATQEYHGYVLDKILGEEGIAVIDDPALHGGSSSVDQIQDPVIQKIAERLSIPSELSRDEIDVMDYYLKKHYGVHFDGMEPEPAPGPINLSGTTEYPRDSNVVTQGMTETDFYQKAENIVNNYDGRDLVYEPDVVMHDVMEAISVSEIEAERQIDKMNKINTPVRRNVRERFIQNSSYRPLNQDELDLLELVNDPAIPDSTITVFIDNHDFDNQQDWSDHHLDPNKDGPLEERIYAIRQSQTPLVEQLAGQDRLGPVRRDAQFVTANAAAKAVMLIANGRNTMAGFTEEELEDSVTMIYGSPTWSEILAMQEKYVR